VNPRNQIGLHVIVAIVVLVLHANFSLGDSRRAVEEIVVSEGGEYTVGYMSWYGRGLFPYWSTQEPELIILGEVIFVSSEVTESDISGTRCRGAIKVDQLVRYPQRLQKDVRRIESLSCDKMYGLEEGDRVFVFMVPYEGAYAIPGFTSTNCAIGYRVPPEDSWGGSSFEADLIRLFESARGWDPREMTVDDLRLWFKVDPSGAAFCAFNRLEGKDELYGEKLPPEMEK